MTCSLLTALLVLAAPQPAPPKARFACGVEIGAKGVKVLVLKAETGPNGRVVTTVFAKTWSTTIVDLKNGEFREEAIKDTAKAVDSLIADACAAAGGDVRPEDFHLVASSGIAAGKNAEAMKAAVEDAVGKVTKVLCRAADGWVSTLGLAPAGFLAATAEKFAVKKLRHLSQYTESRLLVIGMVPEADLAVGTMLDIGSGNVKWGCFQKGDPGNFGLAQSFTIPWAKDIFGTVRLSKEITAAFPPPLFPTDAALRDLRRKHITEPILDSRERHTAIWVRKKWYVTGGAAWAFATTMFPDQALAPIVEFTQEDVHEFRRMVLSAKGFPSARTERYKTLTGGLREKAEAKGNDEYAKVLDNFGLNAPAIAEILTGFVEACEVTEAKGKKLYFVPNNGFGWLHAYLKDQKYLDAEK